MFKIEDDMEISKDKITNGRARDSLKSDLLNNKRKNPELKFRIENSKDKSCDNIDQSQSDSISETNTQVNKSKRKQNKWTKKEDELLKNLVKEFDGAWTKISSCMIKRTPIQCLQRWTNILKPGLVKGHWSEEEDEILKKWVSSQKNLDFTKCNDIIKGRSGKQCKERWLNVLNPDIVKGNWTKEEDYIIFKLYSKYGGKWNNFTAFFNGSRSENMIKNRFYSSIRRFTTCAKKSGAVNLDEVEISNSILKGLVELIMDKMNFNSMKELENYDKNVLKLDRLIEFNDEHNLNNSHKKKEISKEKINEQSKFKSEKIQDIDFDNLEFCNLDYDKYIQTKNFLTNNVNNLNFNDEFAEICSVNTDKNYSHMNSPLRYDFNNNNQDNLHENTIEELESKIMNFCNENECDKNLNLNDETTMDISKNIENYLKKIDDNKKVQDSITEQLNLTNSVKAETCDKNKSDLMSLKDNITNNSTNFPISSYLSENQSIDVVLNQLEELERLIHKTKMQLLNKIGTN